MRLLRLLHRHERGSVALILLLIVFALWALLALVWNTGAVISTKIRVQTAADAAAYEATVWTSRTTNLIAASNRMIVRTASARALALSYVWTVLGVEANWIRQAKTCGPFFFKCLLLFHLLEGPPLVYFSYQVGSIWASEAFGDGPLQKRIGDLSRFQHALVAATPKYIAEQNRALAEYYDCQIHLTRPGISEGDRVGAGIRAPVRRPESWEWTTFLLHMLAQVRKDRSGWNNYLEWIYIGQGGPVWRLATFSQALWMTHKCSDKFYVMANHGRPLPFTEPMADLAERQRYFTILALAARHGMIEGKFNMSGVFNRGVNPSNTVMAMAQAETFNPFDYRYNEFYELISYWPWRVWSTLGWNWQPRLTEIDALEPTLESDEALRALMRAVGIEEPDYDGLGQLMLH
jgi:hypothetical protein